MSKDEFMFGKWTTEALILRRKSVLENLKQCSAYDKELKSINSELLKRKINVNEIK